MPDFAKDMTDGAEFEKSVRQIVREIYAHSKYSGSMNFDGRERDEVIDTGTELIIVEATISRKLLNTQTNLRKSIDLVKKLRSQPQFLNYNFRIMLGRVLI